jgi:hypothetical protein
VSKLLRALLFVLATAAPATAQVTGPPHVFVAGTVASPDEVNLNFSTIYAAACNRGGCTMTGNLLFSADNTIDIGASGANRPRDLFLGRNAAIGGTLGVTGAATLSNTLTVAGTSTLGALSATTGTFSSTLGVSGASTLAALSATTGSFSSTLAATTLTLSNTGASALDVAGGINAGTGNVGIVGTDGRIPAISSTTFASLSGANLTGLLEANITDGSLLARVASNEVITGAWTIGNGAVIGVLAFNTPALSNSGLTFAQDGVANGQILQSNAGSFWDGPGTLEWRTVAGVTRATLTSGGLYTAVGGLTSNGPLTLTNAISPATLASGNTNDYNPAGLSTAAVLRLVPDAANSTLTGLTAQTAGAVRVICNAHTANGSATPTLTITAIDANSATANRFNPSETTQVLSPGNCRTVWYDGTSARWRFIG